jgi:hypothetical protein
MAGRRGRGRGTGVVGVGELWRLQLRAARLGAAWVEMSWGAAQVIAARTAVMGAAMAQPARVADPELALMVAEKVAAVREAAERLARHAVRQAGRPQGPQDAARLMADGLDVAAAALSPFRRRVRANVRRLGSRKPR